MTQECHSHVLRQENTPLDLCPLGRSPTLVNTKSNWRPRPEPHRQRESPWRSGSLTTPKLRQPQPCRWEHPRVPFSWEIPAGQLGTQGGREGESVSPNKVKPGPVQSQGARATMTPQGWPARSLQTAGEGSRLSRTGHQREVGAGTGRGRPRGGCHMCLQS